MAKKAKDKQVTHIEKEDLKARQAAINEAIKVIEKEYGKGAIMDISSENPIKVEAVSSGSLAIDSALGIGGYPKGRIVEVYGPESSGKTTIALLQKFKKLEELQHLSMQRMHLILNMLKL